MGIFPLILTKKEKKNGSKREYKETDTFFMRAGLWATAKSLLCSKFAMLWQTDRNPKSMLLVTERADSDFTVSVHYLKMMSLSVGGTKHKSNHILKASLTENNSSVIIYSPCSKPVWLCFLSLKMSPLFLCNILNVCKMSLKSNNLWVLQQLATTRVSNNGRSVIFFT